MHLQSLKVLHPTILETMHLQEITLFDLWRWPKVKDIWSVAKYPLHHVIYAPAKFEAAMSNGLGGGALTRKYIRLFDLFILGVKATRNIAQFPLHHVIYASAKFEISTSYGLGDRRYSKRNVTDGQTDGRTHAHTDGRRTDFGTKLIYPFFLTKKRE